MTTYDFDAALAIDGAMVRASNAVGYVYDPADTSFATPLAVTDLAGVPMASIVANSEGVVPPFSTTLPLVRWKSGAFILPLDSAKGLRDETLAAKAAALASQTAAEAAQAAAEAAEAGVPPGGTTGQVLTKNSNTTGDADWATPTGGGGSGTPDDASVTNAKVATGAAIDLAKTADTSASGGRLAMTTAERAAIAAAAADSVVVKLSGNQTIAGTKTFSSAPAVPDASFTTAKVASLAEYIRDTVATALRGVGIDVSVAGDDAADTLTLTGGVSDDPTNGLSLGSDFKPFFSSTGLQPAGSYLTATDIEWFLPLAVVTNFTDNPPAGFPDGGIVFSRNPSA